MINLTPKQTQVVELLRQGWSTADIAKEMAVCEGNIKHHMQIVGDKLGLTPGHALGVRIIRAIFQEVLDKEKLKKFTPVQRDIVPMAMEGVPYHVIAKHFGISVHRVKNLMHDAFDRIGASSKRELLFMLSLPNLVCTPPETAPIESTAGRENTQEAVQI